MRLHQRQSSHRSHLEDHLKAAVTEVAVAVGEAANLMVLLSEEGDLLPLNRIETAALLPQNLLL